ncbi:MAG: ABC transporter ATP-binding protein [Euryarchaeota archaeon]|nr:ABC transporter ATP-binding protein [Euryarchaeota archaeon]MDE1836981.1 ABC transporter ATP-binding protein [Euryarchaeota archaeon]MDE1880801.1 ABC transporter ATP-binding protein [Euryarchaeota archaeon]MDE2046357.1 ABC transporter ATP-binding protein [Thermoplasmata archaeon]
MPEPIVVEGRNVWKVYASEAGEVPALKGIDVSIAKGEMVAVMGPSGCGKTTFLNCFSGLDDISKGTIRIEGRNLRNLSDNARSEYRALRMGFVFQAYNLLPVLTAQENVELPLLVAGVAPKEARNRARLWLNELGLQGREEHRPSALSGGEQQRVTLARALANRPAIVWADEPTGNLDEENSTAVMELLRDLNRQHHQTFVVVTHDPSVAASCDRTMRMRDGKILAS